MRFSFLSLKLDLAVNWKISRNSSLYKENFFFQIHHETNIFKGEIAPNIRYGEEIDKVRLALEKLCANKDLASLKRYLAENKVFNSIRCGVEQALIGFKAFSEQKSIHQFLGIQLASCSTSFSIPIMEEKELAEYLYKHSSYDSYKIKIDRNNGVSFVKAISKLTNRPLRIDANESFLNAEDFLLFYKEIENLNIEFIEQPMPSSLFEQYIKLKPFVHHPLVADESIEDVADFNELKKGFDVINIKLMKTGGVLKALSLITEARKAGLDIMIGCMIETSLGISYAMNLVSFARFVDLDGALLLKEDPYKHLINYKYSLLELN